MHDVIKIQSFSTDFADLRLRILLFIMMRILIRPITFVRTRSAPHCSSLRSSKILMLQI